MYNRNIYTASDKSAVAASAASGSRTVTIIDPAFRTGKLELPIEKTSATKGRDEWLEGKLRNRDLSLCCLFQKGRCHAQERCHQVHADRDYVISLREQQRGTVSCCRHCQDTASLSQAGSTFFAKNMPTATSVLITFSEHDEPNVVPASRIAFTDGLIQQFHDHGCKEVNGSISIPVRRVCRLHAKGVCKYGKDCKNVHVCCELGEAVMVRRSMNSAVVSPAKPVAQQREFTIPNREMFSPAKAVPFSPAKAMPYSPAAKVTPYNPAKAPPVYTAALPVFSVPKTIKHEDKDPLEKTKSVNLKLNAESLNESSVGSGRLRALVFDVLKCLDDSYAEAKKDLPEEDNFSYFSSTKSSSRKPSIASESNSPNTANLTPSWGQPMWQSSNIFSPATVDPNQFRFQF